MFIHRVIIARVAAVVITALAPASLAAQRSAPTNIIVAGTAGAVTVSWAGIRDRSVSYRVLRSSGPEMPGEDLTKPLGYTTAAFVDASVVYSNDPTKNDRSVIHMEATSARSSASMTVCW